MTNRIAILKPLTVQSVNGPAYTYIVGQGPIGNTAIRCAYVSSNGILSGFTLTNGHTRGVGNYDKERYGGGVWCGNGGVVSNCVISSNGAFYGGGGVYCMGGSVKNSVISNNFAGMYGGGVDCRFGTTENCAISHNSSSNSGGGVYLYIGAAADNCVISFNYAHYSGGGISTLWGGPLNNCMVMGNSADSIGGGVKINAGGIIQNCTITRNSAVSSGGGVWISSGDVVENSVIYSNDAPSGVNWYNSGVSLGYYYCCLTPDPGSPGNNNVTNDPQLTLAGRLNSISPCINAGNNAYVQNPVDLDGNPRIVFGTVDMGSYEYIVSSSDYDGDGLNNSQELITWHTDPTLPDTDRDGSSDYAEVMIAGTSPNDCDSRLALYIGETTNYTLLSWSNTGSRTYNLWYNHDLMTGTWQKVGTYTNLPPGITWYTNNLVTNTVFFRVTVVNTNL